MLARLPFPVYITTNPDDLMEQALELEGRKPQDRYFDWLAEPRLGAGEAGKDTDLDRTLFEVKQKRGPRYGGSQFEDRPDEKTPLVYHLFGTLKEVRSLVLTEDDYFDYIANFVSSHVIQKNEDAKSNFRLIRSYLVSSSLLFLGFRLEDWTFRVLFRSIRRLAGSDYRNKFTSVAVQIDPGHEAIADPGLPRRYLEKYFQSENIGIYWGSVENFLKELAAHSQPDKKGSRGATAARGGRRGGSS